MDLDSLHRGPEPYLGWYLEGAPAKDLYGVARCLYTWYATEDRGSGRFDLTVDPSGIATGHDEKHRLALEAGFAACRGKVFLGSWRQDAHFRIELPRGARLGTPVIREAVLRGLHRLYEAGFADDDIEVDIVGVALDLGAKPALVSRAIEFLLEKGWVEEAGTLGRNRSTGHIWISVAGVTKVESEMLPVEAFLQEVYSQVVGQLSSFGHQLAGDLEGLRESAGTPFRSPNELVGFAARVRDFVEELTDTICKNLHLTEPIERNKTLQKVRAITARAKSTTRRDHVRALAEVVETHWNRLNTVQQRGVHAGLVEAQRLFAYVLLFVSDLLAVAAGA